MNRYIVSKKVKRSTRVQILHLCKYMRDNPGFAAGNFESALGAAKHQREWEALKAELDELGPERSVMQWKVCWRDQKRKARVEGAAQNRQLNQTGNPTVHDISETSQYILEAIGEEMALGLGPPESPIGYTPTRSTSPDLPLPPPPPDQPALTEELSQPLPSPPPPLDLPQAPEPQPSTSRGSQDSRPPQPSRTRPTVTRKKKSNPPDRFINAQFELNTLIKALVKELKRSNELREQKINLMKKKEE